MWRGFRGAWLKFGQTKNLFTSSLYYCVFLWSTIIILSLLSYNSSVASLCHLLHYEILKVRHYFLFLYFPYHHGQRCFDRHHWVFPGERFIQVDQLFRDYVLAEVIGILEIQVILPRSEQPKGNYAHAS